jgi:hypothetical protein
MSLENRGLSFEYSGVPVWSLMKGRLLIGEPMEKQLQSWQEGFDDATGPQCSYMLAIGHLDTGCTNVTYKPMNQNLIKALTGINLS